MDQSPAQPASILNASRMDQSPAQSTTSLNGSRMDKSPAQPIRVAPRYKSKRKGKDQNKKKEQKQYVSPLFDDRGYPNPQDEWESMLPEVKAGRLIRKRIHNPPKLQEIDPNFGVEFDE